MPPRRAPLRTPTALQTSPRRARPCGRGTGPRRAAGRSPCRLSRSRRSPRCRSAGTPPPPTGGSQSVTNSSHADSSRVPISAPPISNRHSSPHTRHGRREPARSAPVPACYHHLRRGVSVGIPPSGRLPRARAARPDQEASQSQPLTSEFARSASRRLPPRLHLPEPDRPRPDKRKLSARKENGIGSRCRASTSAEPTQTRGSQPERLPGGVRCGKQRDSGNTWRCAASRRGDPQARTGAGASGDTTPRSGRVPGFSRSSVRMARRLQDQDETRESDELVEDRTRRACGARPRCVQQQRRITGPGDRRTTPNDRRNGCRHEGSRQRRYGPVRRPRVGLPEPSASGTACRGRLREQEVSL